MTPSHFRKNTLALAAVCLAALMFGLEISSVPVILPTLEQVLNADFKELQWVMNAYTIACSTVLMATGTLADRYGRRRIFIISLTLFGLTSLLCGLAQNMPLLIAARFLQGLSGGAMLICQIAILSQQFEAGAERGKAFAAWGIVFGFGLGFGPVIGGLIVTVSNWQWVFLVHVAITLLTLILVVSGVQESRDPQKKKLDIAGILTLACAVLGLTYFITQGPELGWASPAAIGILAASAISFILFVVAEKCSMHPMFDFSVFKIRHFSAALLGAMGMNFSFWPLMIYLPIYFQAGLGYDSVNTGLALLAYTLPTLIMPPIAERFALRYQSSRVIPLGLVLIGLGFILMLCSSAAHASGLTMLPGCLLAGIGLGLTNTPVTNTTTGSVPSSRAGMASGIDMSARMVSLAINIAVMGFILVEGILFYLQRALPAMPDTFSWRPLAQHIAAGNTATLTQRFPELSAVELSSVDMSIVVQTALAHGFSWVMLYGAMGVWVLAALSFVLFNSKKTLYMNDATAGR